MMATQTSRLGTPSTIRRVDTSHLTGAQKAAILIMYLDENVVRDLFGRMSEDEIRRVGEAISRLDHVEPDLVQTIIAEFAGDLGASLYLQAQGDRYLRSVFPAVLGQERAHRLLRSIEPVSRQGFQQRFSRVQPGALAARLSNEHPQTIAVACSVLGPDLCAAVLPSFELDLQVDVVMRMAKLKRFPVELLEDIESLLGDAEVEEHALHNIDTDGSRMVADTINNLAGEQRDELLAALSQKDEGIAGEVSRQMFSFDMLCNADAKGVQNLLKEVERKELALALKGADGPTREKFYSNMSERAADYLKDDMEAMGPVRLSEVESAQQQIIALSLRLEEEGKLIFLGGGEAVVE
jgi:flagellar motor switch protein FliG